MMTANEDCKGLGRDTTVCGDPKLWFMVKGEGLRWFPMRVTYSREMKVKGELDRLGIENFVPMTYRLVESRKDGTTELRRETNTNLTDDTNIRDHGDERTQMTRIKRIYGETDLRRVLVPAVNNLIFVRSTQERISGLKVSNEVLEPLRYMMDRTYWRIGRCIAKELDAISDEKYGSKIVSTVSRQLTERYGKGYQRANLFRMLKVARVFPDEETVSTLIAKEQGSEDQGTVLK